MYFLIPREVGTDKATLWMAAVDEPHGIDALQLAPGAPGIQSLSPPQQWPAGANPRIRHREVEVTGLSPRTTYPFLLMANGNEVAKATVTTLPVEMPLLGDKPFTVLLGSCFAYHEDEEGKVGNTFFQMPYPARPDLKILAGDQVYLDSPWQRFAKRTHGLDELRDIFMNHYAKTWGQTDGFARLLNDGANFFAPDDHEYWNNAPNFAAFAQDTWTSGGRRNWYNAASELYAAFQSSKFITPFAVPPVSFLILDTRTHRDEDRINFMDPADLKRVGDWIKALTGPGVIVIGQPLLQASTGFFKGHFGDWNLPDFEQYHALVQIVGTAEHSLVILTGDVHYGRVARSSLRSGAELIEIISSPLSLVDEKAKGSWEKAPPVFPAVLPKHYTPAWLARSEVVTDASFAPTWGHFLTLEFTRRGPGAHLRLRFWPVFERGEMPPPAFGKTVWERVLT